MHKATKSEILSSLQIISEFYEMTSHAVTSHVTIPGANILVNLDTYIFSSMASTLKSMEIILREGHVGDALTLLRKYHDLTILSLYIAVFEKQKQNVGDFSSEELNMWLSGKERMPQSTYKDMASVIEKYPELKEFGYFLKSRINFKKLRADCNDHTHFNHFSAVSVNDKELYDIGTPELLRSFKCGLKDIVVYHTCLLACLYPNYFSSSDYIDHLEVGQTPPNGCQYWASPYFMSILDKFYTDDFLPLKKMLGSKTGLKI